MSANKNVASQETFSKDTERIKQEFLAMQKVIDEMNNTRESLISSLEYLPFTNKD